MNKALEYALRLLKYRPRSERELCRRLKRRGLSQAAINEAIRFLKETGLVDDREFARAWVESRSKKPLGAYRLRRELRVKGVDKEIIEKAISAQGLAHNEEREIKGLLSRRRQKLRGVPPQKAKQRLYLYLLRRGFSSGKIREAIDGS